MDQNRVSTVWFVLIGIFFSTPTQTLWLAMEDILAGSTMTTSVLVITFSALDVVSRVSSPLIVRRLPLIYTMIFNCLLTAGPLLLIVLTNNVQLRIVGMAIAGYSFGFGVIAFLQVASNCDNSDDTTSAFQYGCTNFSTLFASIGYTGLTTWVCVAPRTVVACCIPLSLVTLVFYPLLGNRNFTTTRYQMIRDDPSQPKSKTVKTIVMQEVIVLTKVFPTIIYFFLESLSWHLSLSSIVTTLTFPSSPFLPRDHYQYYRLVGDIGVTVGGMEVVLVSCLCSKWLEIFKIRRVWIMVFMAVSCMVFYVFASWFRFLPNVYVLLAMIFVLGVVSGSVLVHGIALASNLFSNAKEKVTALGYVQAAYSVGRITGGLLGLHVENALKEHCTNSLLLGKYCLTRVPSSSGWEHNVHC